MPNFENPQGQISVEQVKEQIRRDEQQKRLVETVEALGKKIDSLCEKFPGLCSTQESIEARLRKNESTKPKTGVLGTDLTLGELLKSEKSQENLAEKYMSETGLLYALKRCTGAECQILRERAREQGINLQTKGKGSMPGSSGWKDID